MNTTTNTNASAKQSKSGKTHRIPKVAKPNEAESNAANTDASNGAEETGNDAADNSSEQSRYRVADGKRNGKAAVTCDIFNSTLTLNFATGDELVLNADTLSPEIKHAAMMHGLKQKLIDAAAIGRDILTGASATPKDKYNAVKHVFDRITAAEGATWNKGREEGASPGAGGLLVAALMRISGKTKDEVTAYLEPLTGEQKAALRNSDKVAPVIAAIKAEQGATKAKGIDTDALLSQLA